MLDPDFTVIPVRKVTKGILRSICKKRGMTYDGLINQWLTTFRSAGDLVESD